MYLVVPTPQLYPLRSSPRARAPGGWVGVALACLAEEGPTHPSIHPSTSLIRYLPRLSRICLAAIPLPQGLGFCTPMLASCAGFVSFDTSPAMQFVY